MFIIETGKELILENVLSLRKKLTQEEINNEMIDSTAITPVKNR